MKVLISLLFLAPLTLKAQISYNGEDLKPGVPTEKSTGTAKALLMAVGAINMNQDKYIEGKTSNRIIKDSKPVFTFRFGMSQDTTFMQKSNMESFYLMRLHRSKDKRCVRTMRYKPSDILVRKEMVSHLAPYQEDIVPIKVETTQAGPNIFLVSPKENMEKGEYGFYYNDSTYSRRNVYDFTIK